MSAGAGPIRRTLRRRELNRAMLRRQLLLGRVELPVAEAVHRLLGLNAQAPNLPYLALACRLRGFAIEQLTTAIEDGSVVRSTLMRGTQHVVSAADFSLVRPAVAPMLRRVQRTAFGRRIAGADPDELAEAAAELLADGRVVTRPELGRLLAARWPEAEPTALGWSAQYLLPLIHPAPSGTWNTRGATPFALASERIDVRSEATTGQLRELVRRYLAAFGPATVADVRAWSGVSGLREIVEQLRPELRVFLDESGRELFDLPDPPIAAGLDASADAGAEAEEPAPVRFLPEFDAPLLAYADRGRIMTPAVRRAVCVGAGVAATVLVDGTVAATWEQTRDRTDDGEIVALTVRPFRRLSAAERTEVEAEGLRLCAFLAPDAAGHDVRILAPDTPPESDD